MRTGSGAVEDTCPESLAGARTARQTDGHRGEKRDERREMREERREKREERRAKSEE